MRRGRLRRDADGTRSSSPLGRALHARPRRTTAEATRIRSGRRGRWTDLKFVNAAGESTDVGGTLAGRQDDRLDRLRPGLRPRTNDSVATRPVSPTAARHGDLAWSPDGGTLYFTRTMNGMTHSWPPPCVGLGRTSWKLPRMHDAARVRRRPAPDPGKWSTALAFHVEAVTEGDTPYRDPVPSNSGRKLALHEGLATWSSST